MKIEIKSFSTRITETNVKTNKEPRVKAALIVKKIKKESDRFTYSVPFARFLAFRPSANLFHMARMLGTHVRVRRSGRYSEDFSMVFFSSPFATVVTRHVLGEYTTSRVSMKRVEF